MRRCTKQESHSPTGPDHCSLECLKGRGGVVRVRARGGSATLRELGRRAAWRRIDVPNRFRSEDVGEFSALAGREDVAETADQLKGNGISPGMLDGEVRVLRSPDGAERFALGSVLVAPATDPGWTPLFARAGAIVVEIGGALSHSGILAREFGIPCVANIPNVTRLLQDGDIVCVDGTAGLVTRMSGVHRRH
jgi:phosphohistidine swiveling domain-containing protein